MYQALKLMVFLSIFIRSIGSPEAERLYLKGRLCGGGSLIGAGYFLNFFSALVKPGMDFSMVRSSTQ